MNTVAIAGATGFIGRALTASLLTRGHRVVGITRHNVPERCVIHPGFRCPVEWRKADLYSMYQCERALEGVHTAFYLVHSMLPSARLTQGRFQDLDLIMADNFARAAKAMGVQHIVYLGGFIPPEAELSHHLQSRLEVESTLAARDVPLTAIRAGIVVGPGGSSTKMILLSVQRLRVIPCPPLARSLTQPIALSDMLAVLNHVLEHPPTTSASWDVGGPEVLTYEEVLQRAAKVIHKDCTLIRLPVNVPLFSKRLLTWITGTPYELVSPLIDSLKHNMVALHRELQERAQLPTTPLEVALTQAFTEPSEGSRHTCCIPIPSWKRRFEKKDVRSIQRIPYPEGKSIEWIARQYAKTHTGAFSLFVRAELDPNGNVRVYLKCGSRLLLELSFAPEHSSADRFLFFITGGSLAHKEKNRDPEHRPRLEFRRVLAGKSLLVAIHDYRPTLPWPIYYSTQALLHLLFMKRFAKRLKKFAPLENA